MDAEENQTRQTETVNAIWRAHAALDAVYGTGWSKENPHIVARFMLAFQMHTLALEVGGLHEVLRSGSGGLTVGIEK